MIEICPCCGSEMQVQRKPSDLEHFTPGERTVLNLLEKRQGGVAVETLGDALYGSLPNGGPDWGEAVIKVHVSSIRKKLRKHGFKIRTIYNFGYKLERE